MTRRVLFYDGPCLAVHAALFWPRVGLCVLRIISA